MTSILLNFAVLLSVLSSYFYCLAYSSKQPNLCSDSDVGTALEMVGQSGEQVKKKAIELSKAIENEDGVQGAVDVFHKHLRKRIPEIMHETLSSPPRKTKGEKFFSFCTSLWTCQRSESKK